MREICLMGEWVSGPVYYITGRDYSSPGYLSSQVCAHPIVGDVG